MVIALVMVEHDLTPAFRQRSIEMLLGAIRSLSKTLAKKSYDLRSFLHFSSLFVVRGRFE